MILKNLMSEGTACFAGRRLGTCEHTVQGKTEQTSYTIKESSCSFFLASAQVSKGKFGF